MCVFYGHCHWGWMEFLRGNLPRNQLQGARNLVHLLVVGLNHPSDKNMFDKAWIMGPQGESWGEKIPTKNIDIESRNHHHLVQDTPHLTS